MLLHKLDPEGDVLLTLHNSDAPFAVWREDWDKDVSASSVPQDQSNTEHGVSPPPGDDLQSETGVYPDNEQWLPDLPDLPDLPEDGTSKSIGPPPTVQFLLSSRHLILASKYFESTLCGPWKEGALVDSNGIRRVEAEGWSVASMLILMQVIHGHNRKVPRDLTLEALAKIAVLVNHYQCHDAVMTWSDIWINPLRNSMPAKFNRDIVLWILVAKVFEKNDLFNKATKIALEDCRGQLPTLNLPIMEVASRYPL
ncbi:hypothetical protein F4814DRAFT_426256 [Daldinia grandis]|nr:hypothetical protein F4814DRAFT_426256 [Daldinia grandis]